MKLEDIFSDFPVLETEKTILRKITEQDVHDVFEYASDEEVARYTTWHAHRRIEDSQSFITIVLNDYNNHQRAPWGIQDKLTGKLIGTCGFVSWNINHSRAELGYALSREYWGRGYMTEVVKKIIV